MKKIIFTIILFMLSLLCQPELVLASETGLVIDEFKTRSEQKPTEEYIVLKNYGVGEINLMAFSLTKKVASGNNYTLVDEFPNIVIKPGSRIVIGHRDYQGISDLKYTTGNSLADSNNAIILTDGVGQIIDSVTYGEVAFLEKEGEPLNNPQTGIPYLRKNGQDTDNNSLDFEAKIPEKPIDQNGNKVIISELLPDPDDGSEWFELFNPTNQVIKLENLKICDLFGSIHCYSFPAEEVILPFQYKTYDQSLTKITLNNDGDMLELQDYQGNIFSNSGQNYGDAEGGAGFTLFGSQWRWTTTPTKGSQNIFTDIVELEPATTKSKKKASTKKTSTKTKTTTSTKGGAEDDLMSDSEQSTEAKVLGDDIMTIPDRKISHQTVGLFLVAFSAVNLIGYIMWERKDRINEIYKRLSRKNN